MATLFFVAGQIGGGVAEKLKPHGIDDPETESVIAQKRLERACFRDTGLAVLIEQTSRSPSWRQTPSRADARGVDAAFGARRPRYPDLLGGLRAREEGAIAASRDHG